MRRAVPVVPASLLTVLCWSGVSIVLLAWSPGSSALAQTPFVRGDVNDDGTIDLSDLIGVLSWIQGMGGPPVLSPDAADVNDNGVAEISDIAYFADMIFWGGPEPPPPYPNPGLDTTPPDFPDAPTGEVSLLLGAVSGCPGTQVIVPLTMDSTVDVDALSVRVLYDSVDLTWVSADEAPFSEFYAGTAGGNVFQWNEVSTGVLEAILIPNIIFDPTTTIPAGSDLHLTDLIFEISPAATLGTSATLGFTDGAGVPPFPNLVSASGEAVLAASELSSVTVDCVVSEFVRGDSNGDGSVSVSDAAQLVAALFLDAGPLSCERSGDTNSDGGIDVADAVFLLQYLFSGGPVLASPFPDCGLDPLASPLSCETYAGGCP